MKKIAIIAILMLAGAVLMTCVGNRPTRTEIYNENTYLVKDFLTRPNPNHFNEKGETDDYGWFMSVSRIASSVPAPILTPTGGGGIDYVRFAFGKDTMQVIDLIVPSYAPDDNLINPTDAANFAPRVLQEFDGSHVDIRLSRNLDNEVTNFVEEYKERDWQDREYFKTDLEDGAFSAMSKISWYYDFFYSSYMRLQASTLVDGSIHWVDTVNHISNMGEEDEVDWDRGDYLEWTVRMTYSVNPEYSSLMDFRRDIGTQTVDVKYSFWRRPDPEIMYPADKYPELAEKAATLAENCPYTFDENDTDTDKEYVSPDDTDYDAKVETWNNECTIRYVTRPIKEKDEYKRKFGMWDYMTRLYVDNETGLIGAEQYLSRFNPKLPIDYYIVDLPKEYWGTTGRVDEKGEPVLDTDGEQIVDPDPAGKGGIYSEIEGYTNEVFEKAEVDTRIAFHAADEGGIKREPGDIRYSFVMWHNNDFHEISWLGYGPSAKDPRNGEIVNAVLNYNNIWGMRYYTFMVEELLRQSSDVFVEDKQEFVNIEGSCTPGEMRSIFDEDKLREVGLFEGTGLYDKMVAYMGSEPKDWIVKHEDKPDDGGELDWYDYYQMILNDMRYSYPPYNEFIYSGPESSKAALQGYREDLMAKHMEFLDFASRLQQPGGPFGIEDLGSEGAIEKSLELLDRQEEAMRGEYLYQMDRNVAAGLQGLDLAEGPTLLSSIRELNQKCKEDGTWQNFKEWQYDLRRRISTFVSIHELGHNIGLYHNFYGSVDQRNYQPCKNCLGEKKGISNTVMDYAHHYAEIVGDLGWYPYDWATLIYGYRYDSQDDVSQEKDLEIIKIMHPDWNNPTYFPSDDPNIEPGPTALKHPERTLLYANDNFLPLSPMVKQFDLGHTPTEVVKNHIQYYDFQYKYRNFRSFRQYWDTNGYSSYALSQTYNLRRFLDMWGIDWSGSELENELRILGVEGDRYFFDNLREEFAAEAGEANRMIVNFYRAILTQANAERSYSTTFDSYYGDVTRLGIIDDKWYAMLSFMGLYGVQYNWDVYALFAFYEGWGTPQFYSDALATLTTMLGGEYDVYPWFLGSAAAAFAKYTNNIDFGDRRMKEWIGFRGFYRQQDMLDYFGFDPRYECLKPGAKFPINRDESDPVNSDVIFNCDDAALGPNDDGHQQFFDAEGGKWVYVYLWERNLHLCASVDQSPISYKLIWDRNEEVNINNSEGQSTYTIRYFYDYYKYYNG